MHFDKIALNEYLAVLEKGEEIITSLNRISSENNLSTAFLISGIGMLNKIKIGYFDGEKYVPENIEGACELLSLSGNLTYKNGEHLWHLHTLLGQKGGNAIGGHLFSGTVCVTAEILIKAYDKHIERKEVSPNLWLIA